MGKPLFGRKPAGLKRHKTPKKFDMNERTRKNRRIEDSLNSSGESSEEHSTLVSEEEEEVVVHKEPSMYDDLLKKLGSGCESLANAYKRRQREEEGKSDTEEDSDSGSESISISEKEDDSEEGTDSESPRIPNTTSDTQESGLGVMEQNEDAGSDDDEEAFVMDEHDLRANGQTATQTSVSTRLSCNEYVSNPPFQPHPLFFLCACCSLVDGICN